MDDNVSASGSSGTLQRKMNNTKTCTQMKRLKPHFSSSFSIRYFMICFKVHTQASFCHPPPPSFVSFLASKISPCAKTTNGSIGIIFLRADWFTPIHLITLLRLIKQATASCRRSQVSSPFPSLTQNPYFKRRETTAQLDPIHRLLHSGSVS